jgi:hypothetical protein
MNLPKVIFEKVLGIKGKWIIKARVCLYHMERVRRVEMIFEEDPLKKELFDTGFSPEELTALYDMLARFSEETNNY